MPRLAKRKPARKPDFPLTRHPRGYWCKRVRQKTHYFGRIDSDPNGDAALQLWCDQKDFLLAGRVPRTQREGLTVEDLCDKFLSAKDALLASGELSAHTHREYKRAGARLISTFGADRLVDDLAPEDFATYRAKLAEQYGLVRLAKEIQLGRTILKYGFDSGLIERPVKTGTAFKKPSKKSLLLHRKAKQAKHGKRMFTAEQIRQLLDAANLQLRAMILLAINAGYGNGDCATLPLSAIDLKKGWAEHSRPKTGTDRRCPLWKETVEAIKAVIAKRPTPKSADHDHLVFITKRGGSWSKETNDSPVSQEMGKLLKRLGMQRPNLNFYALRHTFRTVGAQMLDGTAVTFIMGHADADDDMGPVYDEEKKPSDDRLKKVTDHIHRWLFGGSVCDFSKGQI